MSYRIGIFVDGKYTYFAAKVLKFEIDYARLGEVAARSRGGALVTHRYYYTATDTDPKGFSSIHPLINALALGGWTVRSAPAHHMWEKNKLVRSFVPNMYATLAVDALELAHELNEVWIFAGNNELIPLVGALQRRHVRVVVVATPALQLPNVDDKLRRSVDADDYVDLATIEDDIRRAR